MNAHVSQSGWPALVLNADFRPLSYYPLSLWSWQDAIKAVFLERVNIVANYDRAVRSPSFEMKLPSVVSLKTFVKPSTHPAFTRFNVFLRDRFSCQYCGTRDDLTFDHLLPRSRGGHTVWNNVVAACSPCNLRKGSMTPEEAKMWPRPLTTRKLPNSEEASEGPRSGDAPDSRSEHRPCRWFSRPLLYIHTISGNIH